MLNKYLFPLPNSSGGNARQIVEVATADSGDVNGPGRHVTRNGDARSIAQKARWAAFRGGQGTATKNGGGLTAAGRKRLADNMRKRWAAKRTGAQAKKRGR